MLFDMKMYLPGMTVNLSAAKATDLFPRVIFLTFALFFLNGCFVTKPYFEETCKSHAYTQVPLQDYLSQRFSSQAPVRTAVVPFSVPANLSAYSNERPGLGNELAWKLQAALLESNELPIVEVFNRQDWPGKKEEFYTGNFGALRLARDAGYDLVLVGLLNPITSLDRLSVDTKLIDTESGITLWSGRSHVHTSRGKLRKLEAAVLLSDRRPDLLYLPQMVDELVRCTSRAILAVPEPEA